MREAIFNALTSLGAVEDAVVADLFAGSGALAVEALSRGAARAVLVEPDRRARTAIAANLARSGFTDRAEVVATTAQAWLASQSRPVDLALCDPPYGYPDWEGLLTSLAPVLRGPVVVESDSPVPLPDGWHVEREKRYGGTLVAILRPPAPAPTENP